MSSRAVVIVDTCMYDAWAAYDEKAVGTQLGGALRRPASERTPANKEKAISYAAYRALTDLFPADTETVYKPLMRKMGYDPEDNSTDIETPAGIGNVACAAVLEYRHHDGANQLGDRSSGEWPVTSGEKERDGNGRQAVASAQVGVPTLHAPYEDWTGYRAVNAPGTVPARATFTKPLNPDHWQPLTYTDANGSLVVQMFEGAQWGLVKPFALASGDELRAVAGSCLPSHKLENNSSVAKAQHGRTSNVGAKAPTPTAEANDAGALRSSGQAEAPTHCTAGPAKFGTAEYQKQAEELVQLGAGLTERQKTIAEYWTDGEASAAERWMRFAEFVCERDHATLDDEVKLYFTLSNAMMDADIAAWDAKRFYDSARPATAVPLLYRDKKIHAWGGPGKGAIEMDGGQWMPYQPATRPTPPSPEFVAETSAESAAAARVLALWTGSDGFGYSATVAKGSSKIEPGTTPTSEIVLKWATFSEAADEAGMAGRYAGIQFARGDSAGRKLGWSVASKVWEKATLQFSGSTVNK